MEFYVAINKNKHTQNEGLSLCTYMERSPEYIVNLKSKAQNSEYNMLLWFF